MSEGPISAEQVKELLGLAWARINDPLWKARQDFADGINALIRPLIESAVASAQAEMRERCAKVADGDDHGDVGRLAALIRAVALPPAEESFLREKIERAIEAGIEYAGDRKEWNPSPGDWHGPERPTYESIMASKRS